MLGTVVVFLVSGCVGSKNKPGEMGGDEQSGGGFRGYLEGGNLNIIDQSLTSADAPIQSGAWWLHTGVGIWTRIRGVTLFANRNRGL